MDEEEARRVSTPSTIASLETPELSRGETVSGDTVSLGQPGTVPAYTGHSEIGATARGVVQGSRVSGAGGGTQRGDRKHARGHSN
jgi:hypothetical protein